MERVDRETETEVLREALDECRENLQEARLENEELRQSAEAFGTLAERLNSELNAERRANVADRRAVRRETPDRRAY